MLEVITVPVTLFGQNARVLWCSGSKEGVIVDPGGDVDLITGACDAVGIKVTAIWLTHSHLDHCAGVAALLRRYSVPLLAHPDERAFRERVPEIAGMYGLPADEWPACPEPTRAIRGGETLSVGSASALVLFTPGHSPGHLSFYFAEDNLVVSGDALFAGSIGRTDLPGGNHGQLIESISRELLSLPPQTRVLSGHGEDTTIGAERRGNPFLQG
ncbi:MAG: MBL fold metallo-hydrolase [Pseudomonadota bacterium]|jgi:hydroxyacylglutathione hydrolase